MCRIILWGTGEVAREVLSRCQTLDNYELIGFIDNNPQKVGSEFFGKKVFSYKILDEIIPDKIVVLTDSYDDIYHQIRKEYPHFEHIIDDKNYFYKESIYRRYEKTTDKEIISVIAYIKQNGLDIFNYPFVEKYKDLDIEVYYDNDYGMYYVMHSGKPLYFPKKFKDEKEVAIYYREILLEQDKESPHRYLSDDFQVAEGSIVVDVGVAEGIFSLEIVDKVSKIYMIEADENWIEALKITFKDYAHKVIIKKGFVTSYNEGAFMTLDSIIKEPVDFIKMDIEGNEWDALVGAENLLSCSNNLKLTVCTYHSDFDETLVRDLLGQNGISCSTSPGYMWFPYTMRQNYISTRLCRAIVRGIK